MLDLVGYQAYQKSLLMELAARLVASGADTSPGEYDDPYAPRQSPVLVMYERLLDSSVIAYRPEKDEIVRKLMARYPQEYQYYVNLANAANKGGVLKPMVMTLGPALLAFAAPLAIGAAAPAAGAPGMTAAEFAALTGDFSTVGAGSGVAALAATEGSAAASLATAAVAKAAPSLLSTVATKVATSVGGLAVSKAVAAVAGPPKPVQTALPSQNVQLVPQGKEESNTGLLVGFLVLLKLLA